jgi:hypothetical protein
MTRARHANIEGQRIWTGTHQRCGCLGYHFPHRKGGGACEHSPRVDYYRAKRAGLAEGEAQELLSVDQIERMFPI